MSLTLAQARDDMLGMLKTAWDTTGFIMLYPNVDGDIPTDDSSWARTTVSHDVGGQTTLAGANGQSTFQRTGSIIVQIFTASGEGLSNADNYAKIIMDAFEGKASTNGVWFRNVRMNEIGPDGNWYQVNVIIDFEYDEVK